MAAGIYSEPASGRPCLWLPRQALANEPFADGAYVVRRGCPGPKISAEDAQLPSVVGGSGIGCCGSC